jgi:cytochrome c oxidase subunit 2
MQMKIVVESKEDFKKWLSEKQTFAQVIKAQEQPVEEVKTETDSTKVTVDSTLVAQVIEKK